MTEQAKDEGQMDNKTANNEKGSKPTREEILRHARKLWRKYKDRIYTRGMILDWDASKPFENGPVRIRPRNVESRLLKCDFNRWEAYYRPSTDTISISWNCPYKREIWWHEQGHRTLKLRGDYKVASNAHTLKEELRADAIACAAIGSKRMLRLMQWLLRTAKSKSSKNEILERIEYIKRNPVV